MLSEHHNTHICMCCEAYLRNISEQDKQACIHMLLMSMLVKCVALTCGLEFHVFGIAYILCLDCN